ncbi:MAG: polysaccharide pyruvyl transferase CsaB [Armatimonadota bacterium]|nr:polysaccharide pyruvyl transferase CsaB [Armatimonadota bacterium]
MAYRIVVSGYYGFGNLGDEAVLAGIVETFRRLGVPAHFTVLSGSPAITVAQHPSVSAVNRFSIVEVFRAIRNSDLVISGGGSLLQDVTSAISPYYYLSVLRLARMLRRKTMIYAQGVGPLLRGSTRRAVARTFNRTDAITVRDPDSKALLESIGVCRPIVLSADPSFLVIPDVHTADRILIEQGPNTKDILGVSLRPWVRVEEWLPAVAEGVRLAARKLNLTCVSIPLHPAKDAYLLQDYPDFREVTVESPQVAKGLIARCKIIVGMRLHSLMFSASTGVPFVPIDYDPKVRSFAQMSGIDFALSVKELSSDLVRQAIFSTWSARGRLSADLARKAGEQAELALESGRLATRLLVGEGVP